MSCWSVEILEVLWFTLCRWQRLQTCGVLCMDVKGDFMLRLFFWVLAGGVAVAQIQIDLRAQARGGGSGDFAPSKTSGTVITIGAGSFRYGTNFVNFPSPMTFTLQTVPISSIVS